MSFREAGVGKVVLVISPRLLLVGWLLVEALTITSSLGMEPSVKGDLKPHVWMSKVSGDVSVAALNIPGTHNSGARYEPFPRTAKCQGLSIADQLQAGVRFFDVRCRHQEDRFTIFHGMVDQRLTFDQVRKTMVEFLQQNPSEAIIVSIKQEYRSRGNTRTFPETLRSYIAQDAMVWYTKGRIPKLADARGKIVLLSRFSSEKRLGIAARDWGHSGFHQGANLFVQDRFEVPHASAKWKIVERAFQHSRRQQGVERLHLHFTSGYTKNGLGIPNVTSVSTPVNQNLSEYLKAAPHRRHGCIVLDFMTPALAKAIYELNFSGPK